MEDEFWTKTRRQIQIILEGRAELERREQNYRAWLAWHIGALPRSKRYPTLDSMLIKPKAQPPQTWQQQLAIASMWAAHGGGKINRKVN